MLSVILLDLDDTLYDASSAYKLAEEKTGAFASEKLDIPEMEFQKAYAWGRRRTKEILTEGAAQHNRLLYFQHALEYLARNPFPLAYELYGQYWDVVCSTIHPFPGVLPFLLKARKRGLKIGVCTDLTADVQYRKIHSLGLDDYIDALVSSEETGVEKPDERMFFLLLSKLGADPRDAVMLGDSLEKDIAGAEAIGIRTIWKSTLKRYGQTTIANFTDGRLEQLCGIR